MVGFRWFCGKSSWFWVVLTRFVWYCRVSARFMVFHVLVCILVTKQKRLLAMEEHQNEQGKSQPAFTFSKLTIESLEKSVKHVQS